MKEEKKKKKKKQQPDTTKYNRPYGNNMKNANNLDDLEEMDRFLETHNSTKLNQEEIYKHTNYYK